MLFQSFEFLFLLGAAIAVALLVRRNGPQHVAMLVLSYVFYGWWDVRFLMLIMLTSTIDYAAGLGMTGVRLPARKLAAISASLILAAIAFLGINWPLLQRGEAPLSLGALTDPQWKGVWPAIGLMTFMAVLGPFLYTRLFGLSERGRRRAFMLVSIITNLSILGFFKYYNFFTDSLLGIGKLVGADLAPPMLNVVLPVGISFYTFQSMSYVIDVYRKQIEPEQYYIRYLLFVSYFPQLVAGPIIRPQSFLPSLNSPWTLRGENVLSGFHLAMNGFVKKVLIADSVAPYVNQIFNDPVGLPSYVIILAAGLFAIQIYGDFSGYSDIARGVSRMFGVEIPLNFDYPYFSTGIIDFWRRWHISLSTWLRDYLYIPLGGSRVSTPHMYFNLFITMVLGGLWHGASWNFVIWGAYQGGLLIINRLLRSVIERSAVLKAFLESKPGTILRWAVTMYFVLLGWLIFRVTNFDHLWYCMKKFVLFDMDLNPSAAMGSVQPFWPILLAALFCALHAVSYFGMHWAERLNRLPAWLLPAIYAGLGMAFFFFWPSENAAFIYFQF